MSNPVIHNDAIRQFLRPSYVASELGSLEAFLLKSRVLSFRPLATGLYPAAQSSPGSIASGYNNVWVRDNVYVAWAHYLNGRLAASIRVVRALTTFFRKYHFRFDHIIAGAVDPREPMNRVHVRFDGERLEELPGTWSHAQNDALGYFVWLYCKLAAESALEVTAGGLTLLETFAAYFHAIGYWTDEDSGHWEETRKISASSIGVVVGGLHAFTTMLETLDGLRQRHGSHRIDSDIRSAHDLAQMGEQALLEILPVECVQPDPAKARRYDAALLFLIYPIEVVNGAMAERIVADVLERLQGEVGIKRYPGDSYWCADYRDLLPAKDRSRDFSRDIKRRDALLKPGEEAQWCIFDPLLSVIFANRYIRSRAPADRERQAFYFNRSLGQISSGLQCPEAYFLEHGRYVPNDNTPLLWTQANLWMAIHFMKRTVRTDPPRQA